MLDHALDEVSVRSVGWIVVWILTITAGLMLVRFAWVWVSLHIAILRAHRRGEKRTIPAWRLVTATTLAGVKGAITLAGIMTLPATMADGSPFPARNLVISLAMGVILTSLLVASMILPPILRGLRLPPGPSHDAEEDLARVVARDDAVKAIEVLQHRLAEEQDDASIAVEAGARAMDRYESLKADLSEDRTATTRASQITTMEGRLRIAGIAAERGALYRLRREGAIDDVVLRRLVREIDLIEARLIA
ncbi:hypothetical protein [Lichenibacterium dinghuense]|uniref:hypothetical protein n=1 Tax=Lichenibacterium dinghuense TaxID=2895977 RepID=UPI001F2CC1B4|nr:hypothetical protein [Lichenibacterium sp. 6Y81]